MQSSDATAADHEAIGDDAASSGDWASAAAAYQKAVSLDGKSAKLVSKLGRAQYESGDLGAAQPTLEKASKMGAKDACKYLGNILRDQGDVPGATYQYQQYLKGSPRDAAEIEKLIAKMSGG
jgi:Flp pilus assembly protein TadD